MKEWILATMGAYGYFGIALLIAIENIFPPIPSEVILTFGGFMTTYTPLNVWGVVVAATVGSLIGALVLYALGRLLKPERLQRWVEGRVGRMLCFKAGDIAKADQWFRTRGKGTVFFCRFIPIVRSLISIPAGMAGMGMGPFLALTALGSTMWNLVLVWLGVLAGGAWERIVKCMDVYSKVTVVGLGLAFVAAAYFFYKKRSEREN